MASNAGQVGTRRNIVFGLAATALAAVPSTALASVNQAKHDKKAARFQYERLLAALLSGDPSRLMKFEPIQIVYEKKRVEREGYAALQNALTHNNGKPDERPAKLKNFSRTEWDREGKPVYIANLDRSAWFPEADWSGIDGGVMPEGYSYMFELWFVVFDGPHITHLHHNISMG